MSQNTEKEHEDEVFTSLKWGEDPLRGRVFRDCLFESCDVSGVDLARTRWIDCTFRRCNLSNAKLTGATLRSVRFESCKLLGIDWSACETLLLELAFRECDLSYALFSEMPLENLVLIDSVLREAEFVRCNLAGADFGGSDFTGTRFVGCDLRGADCRATEGVALDPRDNRVEGARFDAAGVRGLLEAFGIVVE